MNARLVTLPDACRWIEQHGTGQRPHTATLTRWIHRGINGRKLPAVRAGGGRFFVSLDDVARFLEYRNDRPEPNQPLSAISTARHELEMRQLDELLGRKTSATAGVEGAA